MTTYIWHPDSSQQEDNNFRDILATEVTNIERTFNISAKENLLMEYNAKIEQLQQAIIAIQTDIDTAKQELGIV